MPGMVDGANAAGQTPLSLAEARLRKWQEDFDKETDSETKAVLEDELELASRIVDVMKEELGDE